MNVGRRRETNLGLPAGVREIAGRWYWQPTSKREREERKAQGLPGSVTLGVAGTVEARTAWAVLTGHRAPGLKEGTVGDLLALFYTDGIAKRANGKARSDNTVKQYRYCRPALEKRFGDAKYGTEPEVARGRALGAAEIQVFINASGGFSKKYLAILKNAFDHAIRTGRTTFNPCDKVVAPEGDARTREPLEWEVEALRTMATRVMALLMEFESIAAWRINDILKLVRSQLTADGIRSLHKGGKRRVWEWTPEARRILDEAAKLPGASVFPAAAVFPHSRGKGFTYSGFNRQWQELKRDTTEMLAFVGIVDPDTLEVYPGLAIEDLHFHDLRSKAHDDAVDAGRPGHDLIDDSPEVAQKHYSRRAQRRRFLR